jgi:Flp pilus assembly protein TadD
LARASRANGDLASAINLYRSAIAIKPADPALVVELGDTLVEAGSIDEAIDVYQQVQQPVAARVGALLGLEQAYLTLGQADRGLQSADQARALEPQDRRVLVGRGVALDMLARHKEAQDSYRAALVGAPHDIAARNDLALSLAFTRQFAEAIEILTPMARSSTATPRIRQNLALVYGLAGDTAHAAELSRMDLDANSTQANLRFFEFAHAANQ